MRSIRPRTRSATAVAVCLSALLIAFVPSAPSWGQTSKAPDRALHRACEGALPAGQMRCYAEWQASGSSGAMGARASIPLPAHGYGPADIQAAYQLDQSLGAGETIGIVDAYDNPKAESDLAKYRDAWGLPPCTTASGCFEKVNQRGGSKAPYPDPGWGVEIALDVQAVSAACPNCDILLVEADDPSFKNLGRAVNTAVKLGADVVSNSYGADEFSGIFHYGNRFYTHPGVAQVAASGDFGFGPAGFPAVWGNVIAAGGTHLKEKQGVWKESAWWGAGSGCSAWVDKPAWQHDPNCQMQTVADVSAVADPYTGLAVYDTFGLGSDNGWIQVGGTSLSSPLIAGMIGLAGNAAQLDDPGYIYRHSGGIYDVVGGSNGFCGGDYLCTGKVGYDGPTGLGSPRGVSSL